MRTTQQNTGRMAYIFNLFLPEYSITKNDSCNLISNLNPRPLNLNQPVETLLHNMKPAHDLIHQNISLFTQANLPPMIYS